eukprot:104341_1
MAFLTVSDQRERAPKLWKEIVAIPNILNAWIAGGEGTGVAEHIQVVSSQDDVEENKTHKFMTPFVSSGDGTFTQTSFPVEYAAMSGHIPSPSGRLLAIVREVTEDPNGSGGEKEKKVSCIEVLDCQKMTFCAKSPKIHGKIYTSGQLGGICWSPDESEILFVAEEIPKKSTSFFKPSEKPKEGEDTPTPGDENLLKDSWGAGFVDVVSPKIFVLNLNSRKVRVVKGVSAELSVGQPQWTSDGTGIVFVGYPTKPLRYGVRAYNTRLSKLYYLPVGPEEQKEEGENDGEKKKEVPQPNDDENLTVCLTPDDVSAQIPRFSPDGKKLAYLTTDAVQVHYSCCRLRLMSWPDREIRTLVEIVRNPKSIDEFPGFYVWMAPRRLWSDDGRYLFHTSDWRSSTSVVRVHSDSGTVERIPVPDLGTGQHATACVELLHVSGDQLLCRVSDPITPTSVWLLSGAGGHLSDAKWARVTATVASPCLEGLEWRTEQVVPKISPKGDLNLGFDAVLVLPKKNSDRLPPLVLHPHGGPHSNYDSRFGHRDMLLLTCLGYAVLHINYRGSTGFGQDMLEAVLGTGQDAEDCMDAMHHVDSISPAVVEHGDRARRAVVGCSHGGYLTCMLIGRWPEAFHCAVAHNPVTNIAAMSTMTDITDWCYIESGLPFPSTNVTLPTADGLTRMLANSPVTHAARVRTPLLMLLGGKDVRVPPAQNMEYMRILKQRGVESKTLFYPTGTHGLRDTVSMDGDVSVNRALWIAKYFHVENGQKLEGAD